MNNGSTATASAPSQFDGRVRAPANGELLGRVRPTDPADVAGAVARARAALGPWRHLPSGERAALLDAAAALLVPRADALGQLLAQESGKPLSQAQFEVHGAIHLLEGNAEEARRLGGRVLPTEALGGTARDLAITRREPLGVVAAILPFNWPAELFVEKVAAALAGGNVVVAKAPPEDPLVVAEVHAALVQTGVPADAVQLLHGGADVGAALAQAPGVDAVSLTGSTAAGLAIAQATAPVLRPLHLELGGNNACLVLADADLDRAADEIVRGRLLANGQACAASKRVLVDRAVHDGLAQRLADRLARQHVGDPLDPQTTVGPLISARAAQRVTAQVERVHRQGGAFAHGDGRADGAFVGPVLLTDVPTSADVATDDEIFGPAVVLIPVDGHRHALHAANASSFGLMASVFTADLELALALAERLDAGGVVVNGTDNYRPPVIPFGGRGLSGRGREGLGYALEELTQEKTIVLRAIRGREP